MLLRMQLEETNETNIIGAHHARPPQINISAFLAFEE